MFLCHWNELLCVLILMCLLMIFINVAHDFLQLLELHTIPQNFVKCRCRLNSIISCGTEK